MNRKNGSPPTADEAGLSITNYYGVMAGAGNYTARCIIGAAQSASPAHRGFQNGAAKIKGLAWGGRGQRSLVLRGDR